jgi:hypothetical protein
MAASSAHISIEYRDCTNCIGEIHTIRNISYEEAKWRFDQQFADAVNHLSNDEVSIIRTATSHKVYIVRRIGDRDNSNTDMDTATDPRQAPDTQHPDDMDAELDSLNATIFELLSSSSSRPTAELVANNANDAET